MIRNIDEVERTPVTMPGANGASMAVMVGNLDGAPNFALRQFQIDPGGNTPRHSHPYEHEVYIVAGEGTVLLQGHTKPIRAGDVVYVPADEEHQFRAADGSPLRFLCVVPTRSRLGEPVPGC